VDPHHLFADPDAIYHPDADPAVDPDLDWYGSWCDSDRTFHPGADSDLSFKIRAQTIEKNAN